MKVNDPSPTSVHDDEQIPHIEGPPASEEELNQALPEPENHPAIEENNF